MTKTTVYIGLGSNQENALGSPRWHMQQAAKALAGLGEITASSLYQSLPMGPTDQPDFLNAVLKITLDQTTAQAYPPKKLLLFTQAIEKQGQREKKRHWGERSIDVDILLYDNIALNTAELCIPHPGIFMRNFVAVPLLEVAPTLCIHQQALSQCAAAHDMTGLKKLAADWV